MSVDLPESSYFHTPVVHKDDFTEAEIHSLCSNILDSKYNHPSRYEVCRLQFYINNIFIWNRSKREMKYQIDRNRSIKCAMQTLLDNLAPLRADVLDAQISFSGRLQDDISLFQHEIEDVDRAIRKLQLRTILLDHNPAWARLQTWRQIAPSVASLFREALKPANPELKLGNAPDGPVGRFVSPVLHRITGDSVKPSTVAKHLEKLARQAGKM